MAQKKEGAMPDDPNPDPGTDPQDPGTDPAPDPALDAAKDKGEELGEGGKRALEQERAARREADKKLADATKRLKDIEDANKSEIQKAQDDAKEAADARTAAEARVRDLTMGQALRDEATEQGARKAAGVARLVDASQIDVNDDGEPNPRDVKKAIETVRKEYPELFASGGGHGSADAGARGTGGGGGGGNDEMNQRIRQAAGRTG